MKNKDGITLIALIITIIVMLILIGVTINLSANVGLFKKTRDVAYDYDIAQIKENLADYQIEYCQNTGYVLSDETMTNLAKISKETGVDGHKFVVYYDQGSADNVLIFFNWKKVTLDEMKKLEEINIKEEDKNNGLMYNRMFIADVDGDGYFMEDDIKIMQSASGGIDIIEGLEENKELYYKNKFGLDIKIGDINGDKTIDSIDFSSITELKTTEFKNIVSNNNYYNR